MSGRTLPQLSREVRRNEVNEWRTMARMIRPTVRLRFETAIRS